MGDHLWLAKEWDRRGNRRMVKAIAKSFFRLKRMHEKRHTAVTAGA